MEVPPGMQPDYANMARISHTPAELLFEFGQMLPGQANVAVVARLIMSPVGAKLFFRALGDNLARYEASFGEINLPQDNSLADELFRPPGAPPGGPDPQDPKG